MDHSRIGKPDAVEQIVPSDHHHAEAGHHRRRQVHQRRKHDHRPAQRPQHIEQRQMIVEIELQAEAAEHDQLQKDQPQSRA